VVLKMLGNVLTEHDVDYVSGPYTVTFLAGETSVQFDVVINDDNIVEASEEFSLAIQNKSLPATVTPTNPGQMIVTILDNDSELYIYTIVNYFINQG